jgi:hypothetical protein
VEFYAGEAHVHRAAAATSSFFPFIRLMSVWCLYLCNLGFRHEVVAVVCSLHSMGVAHRDGDDEELDKQRAKTSELSCTIRNEAYSMLRENKRPSPHTESVTVLDGKGAIQ